MRKVLIALTTLAILSLLACRGGQVKDKSLIAVSIAPTEDLVNSLGGGAFEVVRLLPEGGQPESYEPTIKDLRALMQAKAYLYVGALGFEQATLPKIQEHNPNLLLQDLSSGQAVHSCTSHNEPHYWTSFEGIKLMAKNTAMALSELQPKQKDIICQRLDSLTNLIDSLSLDAKQRLEQIETRSFVIYHPSLTYLAEELGLKQLVVENEGKEPSPYHLRSLLFQAKSEGVRVVFVQKEFNPNLSETIAEELGAKIVMIDPLSKDWRGQLALVVKALEE